MRAVPLPAARLPAAVRILPVNRQATNDPANLFTLLAAVRAESTAALAKLDDVDPDALPADLRAEHEKQRRGWFDLLAMAADEVIELHLAGCEAAGRELSAEELRGLLKSGH